MKTTEIEAIMQGMQQLLESIINTETVDKTDIRNAINLSAAIRELTATQAESCSTCEHCAIDLEYEVMICLKHNIETQYNNFCGDYEKQEEEV